jgi:hypothetical protein
VSGEKRPPPVSGAGDIVYRAYHTSAQGISKDFKGRKEKNTPGIKTEWKSRGITAAQYGTIRHNKRLIRRRLTNALLNGVPQLQDEG